MWFVSLGSWLGATQHFSGTQISAIYGTLALAGLITPMLGGAIADRFAHTEKMLALLHAIGGLLLLNASRQTQFTPLYTSVLLYSLCYLPTLSLVPALAMRHLSDPRQEFPILRAVGTAGWIAAGLVVGSLALELSARPMQFAGLLSLAFAAYCLTLPATPPLRPDGPRRWTTLLGVDAFVLLRDPLFAIFLLANVALCIPNQFYNAFGALYLTELHVPQPATLLTLGQLTEVVVLLVLPRLHQRAGVKPVLLLGTAAWVIRCVLFSIAAHGSSVALYAGLLLHGLAYGCTFIAGQIVVHERAPVNMRAAAQGFWALATMGIGNLFGAWVAGQSVQRNVLSATSHNWSAAWYVSGAASLIAMLAVLMSLRIRDSSSAPITH
jgi:nucleoside transporter